MECASSLAALPMSDERYRWLNDAVCTLTGEVRPRSDGSGSDVEYDVAELVWEWLGGARGQADGRGDQRSS